MEKLNDTTDEKKGTESQDQMDMMLHDSLNGFKPIRKGEIIRGKIVKADEEGYLSISSTKWKDFSLLLKIRYSDQDRIRLTILWN